MKELMVTVNDVERLFHYKSGTVPDFIARELLDINSTYHVADVDEQAEYVLDFLKLIELDTITRSKQENLLAFEKGWTENYNRILKDGITLNNLKPGYFRGSKFLRYDNKLVVSDNLQLEFELFKIARYCIFHKYLANFDTICELGCGSCQNLFILSELFPNASIIGADWTNVSKSIADYLGETFKKNICGCVVDMLEQPELSFLPKNSAIVSIHAFEQLGTKFLDILDQIMNCKPGIVVQYEPILEYYNDNLYDFLALKYCKKRNYLENYYTVLKEMEQRKEVEIICAYRPYLGGVLHESSLLVWRPL